MSMQTFVNDIDLSTATQADRLFSYFEISPYVTDHILKKIGFILLY